VARVSRGEDGKLAKDEDVGWVAESFVVGFVAVGRLMFSMVPGLGDCGCDGGVAWCCLADAKLESDVGRMLCCTNTAPKVHNLHV
jgi:hypothetical protein